MCGHKIPLSYMPCFTNLQCSMKLTFTHGNCSQWFSSAKFQSNWASLQEVTTQTMWKQSSKIQVQHIAWDILLSRGLVAQHWQEQQALCDAQFTPVDSNLKGCNILVWITRNLSYPEFIKLWYLLAELLAAVLKACCTAPMKEGKQSIAHSRH